MVFIGRIHLIHNIFKINPNPQEINSAIATLLESGHIISKNGHFNLGEDKFLELQKADIKSKEDHTSRFARFQSLINTIAQVNIEVINKLWLVFNEYILDSFYHYGESAVNHFRVSSIDKDVNEHYSYKQAIEKLNAPETIIFKIIILRFTQQLTTEDLEYLDSLASKTISFHSLGLPQDLHMEVIDRDVFNWIILVDTNFLFSILNLHKHPENEAAHELLKLVSASKLNIDFRFTPFTLRELKGKKTDFSDLIPKEKFAKTHITALLKSGKLDSFSEAYYENLLNNSEATLHPTEVIDHSERTLAILRISKYNSDFAKLSEEHILQKVGDYQHYINIINSAYQERNSSRFIEKSDKLLYHDVLLREAILYLQSTINTSPETISQRKFLGITLDKLLIKYDKYELSKISSDYVLPNFYLPSFLLKKLYQILPVDTQDYKKAFITAIATFSFSESTEKSREVQKIVAYYRNMGLEDEKTLLSFITDDYFINGFFKDDIDQTEFIESEINKKLKTTRDENIELKSAISQAERSSKIKGDELDKHKEEIELLKESERLYLSSLRKIQQKKNEEPKIIVQEPHTIFDQIKRDEQLISLNKKVAELETEKEKLAARIKKEEKDKFIKRSLRNWRKWDWIILAILISLGSTLWIILLSRNEWNFNNTYVYLSNVVSKSIAISSFLGLLSIGLQYYLFKSLYDKNLNKSHIKAAKEMFANEFSENN